MAQILFPTEKYELKKTESLSDENASAIASTINTIISAVVEANAFRSIESSRQVLLAELGAEIQGTWVNEIGNGAGRAVRGVIERFLLDHGRIEHAESAGFKLNHGWLIRFPSEPDVAFLDGSNQLQIAIEIKGSLDTAGAQTRYGEAKKTFSKMLRRNPRCHTIYLASCFTSAVIKQIRDDRQVSRWYNLTAILYDETEKTRFLLELFHVVDAP